ncbi:MAG: bifunctional methylenetetrahydrofolate dehydrogenase/methenyltetrahydrofolate cyclohydrolase FolD [Methanoregulaceae archaeon]|jgi:methylenetetrahydrofolate dehydrogenase (NADP+)/methenyltetrahydrofolate cyclohydrolase|nr:bifunctional methylenetetrahydrofolate dehydrogenase/methenyltetrahydrofolate cyclohydrolase FolD [Methanoregulaceae archaeon]
MILDGKKIQEKRLEILKEEIDESGFTPRLATVIVGSDPASELYVRMKHRACEQVHIGSVGITLPESSPTKEVVREIQFLNRDPEISGILVQLPLPPHINTMQVIESVLPEKDVDGFHPANLGRLFAGNPAFSPCTPQGIMTLLNEYRIDPEGMHAVVMGRSIEVGRPMAALLLSADATVTITHSKTRNLPSITGQADLLVVAIGKPRYVGPSMVKEGAVVIDVGTNRVDGVLCGDVDFDRVKDHASAITPVPGGVGPMTIATLMENTFLAAKRSLCTGVW